MKIKIALITMMVASLFISPAFAESEGEKLAKLGYKSVDKDNDGSVTIEDYQEQASDIFYSMDGDQDEVLTYPEFRDWGFGMSNIAEDMEREQAYDTARKVIFDFWDESFDWKLSAEEQLQGAIADFKRADKNQDGNLSEEEYLKYSIINVAMRSALRPEK